MEEIWKDIPGWENWYQASTLGRIRSCDRIIYCEDGQFHFVHGKLLSLSIRGFYFQVRLYRERKSKTRYVHRLIAETFLENKENLPEVNHLNGIKDDNRLENLEWCNHGQNIIHSYEVLGRSRIRPKGKDCKLSKPVLKFSINNKLIEEYFSIKEASQKNNICTWAIYNSCMGKPCGDKRFIWKYK